jgi:hypothetical protein
MRMWMVDVKTLCRKHLLGEHSEIHKHRHNFVKGHKMEGRKTQIEPQSMGTRHNELAQEMIRRGYKHNSPYTMPDITNYMDFPNIDVRNSERMLHERCQECKLLKEGI